MDQGLVVELAQRAVMIIIMVSAPMLGLALLVGLAISIFQATTSIQEQTLAFIPKILAILGAIVIFGPWMLQVLVEFTQEIILSINRFIFG